MDIFDNGSQDMATLVELVTRSSCQLLSLTLREGTPSQAFDAIIRSLEYFTALESLTVHATDAWIRASSWTFGSKLLAHLITKPDSPIILPNLRKLTLFRALETYDETVRTFLFEGKRPLEKVVFRPSSPQQTLLFKPVLEDLPVEDERLRKDIEELKQRGMQVEIKLPRSPPPVPVAPAWYGLPNEDEGYLAL